MTRIGLNSMECQKYEIAMERLSQNDIKGLENRLPEDDQLLDKIKEMKSTGLKAALDKLKNIDEGEFVDFLKSKINLY